MARVIVWAVVVAAGCSSSGTSDERARGLAGGAPPSIYVSPEGDDANPGTAAAPKRTINAGLTAAVSSAPRPGKVLVAAGTYAEDLELPDGVELEGGYGAGWVRDSAENVSRITPIDSRGVRFALDAMTHDSAKLSGFTIDALAAPDSRAITVSHGASPSLDELTLRGAEAGSGGSSAALVIEDGASEVALSRSTLIGGHAGDSAGVRIEHAGRVRMTASTAAGGTAAERSAGVLCTSGCPSSTFEDVTLQGGAANSSGGLLVLGGGYRGLTLTRATLRGGATPQAIGVGAGFFGPSGGGAAMIVKSTLVGSVDRGGWALLVSGGDVQVNASKLQGTTKGGGGGGVFCSNGSTCALIDDEIWGVGPGAKIASGRGGRGVEGWDSNLELQRNVIHGGDCDAGDGVAHGVSTSTGKLTAVNNVIAGGACATASGATVLEGSAHPRLVNNQIDAVGRPGGTSWGVVYDRVDLPTPAAGVFVDNAILGGAGSTGAAFFSGRAGPAELRHNNLFGGATLYFTGGVSLSNIAEVNAMTHAPRAVGNVSAAPQQQF